jgi:hypothetical protein
MVGLHGRRASRGAHLQACPAWPDAPHIVDRKSPSCLSDQEAEAVGGGDLDLNH